MSSRGSLTQDGTNEVPAVIQNFVGKKRETVPNPEERNIIQGKETKCNLTESQQHSYVGVIHYAL